MTVEGQAIKGAGNLFASKLLTSLVRFVAYAAIANVLGSTGFGLFGSVISTSLMVQLATLGGASWATMNFYARENPHKGEILSVFGIIVVASSAILIGLVFITPGFLSTLLPNGIFVFSWSALIYPIVGIRGVLSFLLQGSKSFGIEALSRLSSGLCFLATVLYFSGLGLLSVEAVLLLFTFSELIGFVIAVPTSIRVGMLTAPTEEGTKAVMSFAAIAHVSTLFLTSGREGFFLFLASQKGLSEAGYYNLASNLSSPIVSLGEALAYASFAFIAEEDTGDDKLTKSGLKHLMFLIVPSTLVAWALSDYLISIFFISYAGVSQVVNILWLSYGLWGATQMLRSRIYAKNDRKSDALASTIATLVSIPVLFISVNQLGALGLGLTMVFRTIIHGTLLGVKIFGVRPILREVLASRTTLVLVGPITIAILGQPLLGPSLAALVGLVLFLTITVVTGEFTREMQYWSKPIRNLAKGFKKAKFGTRMQES